MAQTPLVFGSSHDRVRDRWCVWLYDLERREVIPLAEYRDKNKSDTAAFDLAHASGSLEDAGVCDRILDGKETEVAVLSPELAGLFAKLATDAVNTSEVPKAGQTSVSVRKTEYDTVHVVRFPF